MKDLNFQWMDLHLNYSQNSTLWQLGRSLCVLYDGVAIELFRVDKTEVRVMTDFEDSKLTSLSLPISEVTLKDYLRYRKMLKEN